ncbi:hypothetical protein BZG21_31275, partial [Escherichia coli]|nr:hypothetical protein [Escherichia coli]
IMIYQMLTGQLPYTETNAAALMKHHLDSPMPPPSDLVPDLAEDLDELVRWCTEKDPEKRPQDASLLLEEIIQIRSTLSDAQLDVGAEDLGGIEDLAPQAFAQMPTTLQQRLDAMQREREEEREQLWLERNAAQQETGYELDDAPADPDRTTVIAAADATEVLDLRDAQATLAPPRAADPGSDPGIAATSVYSRGDE